MSVLSAAALNADIIANIYTNSTFDITGNIAQQRMLNIAQSSLNRLSDLNINGGYLGIASGRVDISFINKAVPTGQFLKDDGTWGTAITSVIAGTDNRIPIVNTAGTGLENSLWEDSASHLLPINQGAKATASEVITGGDGGVADLDSIVLQATSGFVTYTWDAGGGDWLDDLSAPVATSLATLATYINTLNDPLMTVNWNNGSSTWSMTAKEFGVAGNGLIYTILSLPSSVLAGGLAYQNIGSISKTIGNFYANNITSYGLSGYSTDLSAQYTSRSFIDKGFFDSKITIPSANKAIYSNGSALAGSNKVLFYDTLTNGNQSFLTVTGAIPSSASPDFYWAAFQNMVTTNASNSDHYAHFNYLIEVGSGNVFSDIAQYNLNTCISNSVSNPYRLNSGGNNTASIGTLSIVNGASTTGGNFAIQGRSSNSELVNVSLFGVSTVAGNGHNVGTFSVGLNSGAGNAIAGWFTNDVNDPTFFYEATLVTDNGATSNSAFMALINGVKKVEVNSVGSFYAGVGQTIEGQETRTVAGGGSLTAGLFLNPDRNLDGLDTKMYFGNDASGIFGGVPYIGYNGTNWEFELKDSAGGFQSLRMGYNVVTGMASTGTVLMSGAQSASAVGYSVSTGGFGNIGMYEISSGILGFSTAAVERMRISSTGISIGTTTSTGRLTIAAGSTAAGTAPVKLLSGALNTTAEAGAIEFLTDSFYATITTGAVRKKIALVENLINSIPVRIEGAKLPSTNAMRIDGGETNWRLLADNSGLQNCVLFQGVLPSDYGTGLTLTIFYSMTSATSGNVTIGASVMAVTSGDAADINTESFDTVNSETNAVPGTAGYGKSFSITLTNADSLAAEDYFKIKILRSDTSATGDMEIVGATLSYNKV